MAMAAAAAATDEVKLLGRLMSPYVMRAAIALTLKKVRYELVEVEIIGQKSEILLQTNPVHKKIPVLIHRSKPVCESAIIVQYIDEVWPGEPPILPADPFDRALARFWTAYVDDKFPPLLVRLRKTMDEAEKAETAEQAAQVFQQLEDAFAKCSKGKGFFGGERIGYLDISVGSWLGWFRALGKMQGMELLEEKKVPLLVGWAERFLREDAVKGIMPEIDECIQFSMWIAEKMKAAASAPAAH